MELDDLRQSRSRIRRRFSYASRTSTHERPSSPIKNPTPIESNEATENEQTSESECSESESPLPYSRQKLKLYSVQWWPPSEFWNTCISCQPPPGSDLRDFFALERTFLAYHRTALSIAMFAVVITQLLFLSVPAIERSDMEKRIFPAFCIALLGMATMLQILGAIKYWRWERGIMSSKAMVGGWELMLIGAIGFAVVVPTAVFVFMGIL